MLVQLYFTFQKCNGFSFNNIVTLISFQTFMTFCGPQKKDILKTVSVFVNVFFFSFHTVKVNTGVLDPIDFHWIDDFLQKKIHILISGELSLQRNPV